MRQLHAASRGGMVTSPHHLATAAGRDVLARGGNAVEAAIAVGAVLTVVYPHMNSLGGDAFFTIDDGRGRTFGLDGAGPAGAACTPALYESRGFAAMPKRGPMAASTVAGLVAVWGEAWRQARRDWGGGLGWDELLAPALALAREGFALDAGAPACLRAHRDTLMQAPGFADCFAPGGRVPEPGSRFRQPALAESFAELARDGADTFYRGALARRIAAGLRAAGSPLDAEDFARFHCRRVRTISTRYRDGTALNLPPPTAGMTALGILGILERFDLRGMDPASPAFIHLHVEAAKRTHRLRDLFLADPDFADVPVQRLLDPAMLDRLAADIDRERAAAFDRGPAPGDTVWFGVMDAEHRSVSAIQSLCWEYGSGTVAGDTGILWHNRGHGFSFDAAHPNALAPGKRPSHTLNAPLWVGDDGGRIVYGTMGGEAQPQISANVLTRVLDLGMTPAAALESPRWIIGRAWGDQSPTTLKLERRFPQSVHDGLVAMGHDVEWFDAWSDFMGHPGVIRLHPDGRMEGAADPRSDGAAMGI